MRPLYPILPLRYGGSANGAEAPHLRLLTQSGCADGLSVLWTGGLEWVGRAHRARPCDRERDRRSTERGVPAHVRELRVHQIPVRPCARRPTRRVPKHARGLGLSRELREGSARRSPMASSGSPKRGARTTQAVRTATVARSRTGPVCASCAFLTRS